MSIDPAALVGAAYVGIAVAYLTNTTVTYFRERRSRP